MTSGPSVLHIIPSLETGGAEMMLSKLVQATPRSVCRHYVLSVKPVLPVGPNEPTEVAKSGALSAVHENLARANVTPRTLGFVGYHVIPQALVRLRRQVLLVRPDIIQGWMYHGNIVASLARVLFRRARLAWGLRHTLDNLSEESHATRFSCALSRFFVHDRFLGLAPDLLIYNSRRSQRTHAEYGYRACREQVIGNGFDEAMFFFDEEERAATRAELGVASDEQLILMVGRLHPVKGHTDFLRALVATFSDYPKARALLIGRGVPESAEVCRLTTELPDPQRVILKGETAALRRFYSAADLVVIPSRYGESFPNVIGESLLCGTRIVASNLGDCRELIGSYGAVVTPGDAEALSREIAAELKRGMSVVDEEEESKARQQVIADARKRFSLTLAVEKFCTAYAELLSS